MSRPRRESRERVAQPQCRLTALLGAALRPARSLQRAGDMLATSRMEQDHRTSPGRSVGFAVLYRWRLKEGMQAQFQQSWEQVTELLRDQRGGLGSRLHRCDDGIWYAYAQWSDEEAWALSGALGPVDPVLWEQLQAAVAETLPAILLEPVADRLE